MERVKIKWIPQPKKINHTATRIQKILGGRTLLENSLNAHAFSYSEKNSLVFQMMLEAGKTWIVRILENEEKSRNSVSGGISEISRIYDLHLWKPCAVVQGVQEFETIRISALDPASLVATLSARTGRRLDPT